MNDPDDWESEHELLHRSGASLGTGLSEGELLAAEERCGSRFPPDLRGFLSAALPLGREFPNWRVLDDPSLERRLNWPFDGIRFDIEHNSFWRPEWGHRPPELSVAIEVARGFVATAPRLIPICSHRYLPSEPAESGNPVFSVYQTDIIYYGRDLRSYFAHEFGSLKYVEATTPEPRHVRFWGDLVS